MIAQLRGQVISKSPTLSVIDCHGVGYEVFHTPFTAEHLKDSQSVVLFVHTHMREDALQLFGFSSQEERQIFRELLKVTSVGPKLALSILSGIPHQDLILALQSKDIARLQKIPGIGKKTAERLSLELADRMTSKTSLSATDKVSKEAELESVLQNLGYQKNEIQRALQSLKTKEENFKDLSLEALVKNTLGVLNQSSRAN
jgi:Holliday junction DNA helicase RuvA